ncbi:drug resistance transporter, EmrB/QacA subfamily [Nonomuraea solani]|uniref:Drug resistance transporter, EmrB/QacA subfamily n=1 Tax=Nonomuraea solani TaxID=1144553 RepID=A0A1H6ELX4_9ACTN|nr:DHA2 family efflux MFS transporter permease subunit [Nonomuraea solani]SEG98870.1 drug resistance transporter, EmrB/QacA subfamily [Nonomuraea solani]
MSSNDDRFDGRLLGTIAVVLLGGLLGILNSTMAAVATDTLAVAFGASLGTIGWASTGFLLAVTATIPFTTWAVDRYGGKRLWLAGLVIFLAGSLAAGLAWNVGSLIAFRVVQGVGAGLLDPLVLILLARAAGPRRAGRVMGLMGVVLSLGPVLGPIAGGAILGGFTWRAMFLVSVAVGLVALVLAARVLPADRPGDGGVVRLDVLGLALLGPGFAAVVLALSQSVEPLWPAVVGGVLLIGYAAHARKPSPLIDLRLFANRGFSASVAIMGLGGMGLFAALFALPLYYQQAHGHGVLAAGLLMAPLGIGGSIAMPLAGRLSDRLGARGLASGGAVVAILSAFALTRIGPDTPEVWPALAALTYGLGSGFFSAPTMGSLYRTLPPPMVAQGSSVLYMLNQLGAALGVALVAVVVQTAAGFQGVFWIAVAMNVIVLAAVPLLPGRPNARAVTDEELVRTS